MTHFQKEWTAEEVLPRLDLVTINDVKKLRDWFGKNKHYPQTLTDEQLILFLHSCYNNFDNTIKCVESYYGIKRKAAHLFEHRDIFYPDIRKQAEALYYGILPVTSPDGYNIVYHMIKDTEPSKYDFNNAFKLYVMVMDMVYILNGPTPGVILLFDSTGVKLGHVARLPLSSLRRCAEYIQEANPIRLKAIHVINVHPVVDKIMFVLRPFLKKELLSLLHFHKANDPTVGELFPPSCLPKEYGGQLDTIQNLHDDLVQQMEKKNSYFIEEENYLKANNCKKGKTIDADINIKRLEID